MGNIIYVNGKGASEANAQQMFSKVSLPRACRGGGEDYYINGTKIEKYFSILSDIHLFKSPLFLFRSFR
jgi:hypothetical protein